MTLVTWWIGHMHFIPTINMITFQIWPIFIFTSQFPVTEYVIFNFRETLASVYSHMIRQFELPARATSFLYVYYIDILRRHCVYGVKLRAAYSTERLHINACFFLAFVRNFPAVSPKSLVNVVEHKEWNWSNADILNYTFVYRIAIWEVKLG